METQSHSQMAPEFVLGFAFTENRLLAALIEKDGRRFEWMKGKLNGIGGKVEEGESLGRAMAREFHEETGVFVPISRWIYKGKFHGPGYLVHVFTTFTDEVMNVQTMEEEEVRVLAVPHLHEMNLSHNVKWLLPFCLSDKVAEFNVREC